MGGVEPVPAIGAAPVWDVVGTSEFERTPSPCCAMESKYAWSMIDEWIEASRVAHKSNSRSG